MDYDRAREKVREIADAVREGGSDEDRADRLAGDAVGLVGAAIVDIAESLHRIAEEMPRRA